MVSLKPELEKMMMLRDNLSQQIERERKREVEEKVK